MSLRGSWGRSVLGHPCRVLARQVSDSSLLPFQGFFVSVFYCFFNGEVGDQAPGQLSVPTPVESPRRLEVSGSLAPPSPALDRGGKGRGSHPALAHSNPA